MRRLVLMRHAKSSWDSNSLSDHERPLSGRGQRDAPRVAEALVKLGAWPDAVVTSDALRTRQTWAAMAALGPSSPELQVTPELYLAGLRELQLEASSWPDRWQTVLTLGHNPGWEDVAALLSGQWQEMTTANAVVLERDDVETWAEAMVPGWTLRAWLRPRDLADDKG